jgi:hypothetical protein
VDPFFDTFYPVPGELSSIAATIHNIVYKVNLERTYFYAEEGNKYYRLKAK